MLNRTRSHLTRHAVAYVALFVALGGTSYGLSAGSIDSREIRNDTIRTGDVRNNEIRSRDIRNRTIVGRDLLSNSLGGDQIDEQELGEIPLATRAKSADDALALGGVPASSYARPVANSLELADGNANAATVLSVPGYGTLSVPASGCEADAGSEELGYTWTNTSSSPEDVFQLTSNGASTTPSHSVVASAADGNSSVTATTLYVEMLVHPGNSPTSAARITLFARNGGATVGDKCRISAQVLLSG